MSKKTITILHLYAQDMNVYGDRGNVIAIAHRLALYGYTPKIVEYNPGDRLPKNVDILIGGGGQDSSQLKIQDDLDIIAPQLRNWASDGVPMLLVCGLYQLFGNEFITHNHESIKGIGILNLRTIASPNRLIGNTVAKSSEFGILVGYENHSGKTYLEAGTRPLAYIKKGAGNNNSDQTEGARHKNVIGTYLHGPILPKNPAVTDFLIQQAVHRRYAETIEPRPLDITSLQARKIAIRRRR